MATKSAQKSMCNDFMALTGVNEKTAMKLLKASNWKLDQAGDSYFASNNVGAFIKEKDSLLKIFETYRDPSDEADATSVDGTMRYLNDLGVNMENAEFFIPMEIVQAPALGEMTKDGFVDGWKAVGADTLPKQKAYVKGQIKALSSDLVLFKRVYRHAFLSGKESGAKALSLEAALTYWTILFSPPGRPWVSASVDWFELWSEYLKKNWTKTVNKDMWNQTFEFFQKSVQDETLSFWSEDGAWPGVIDDFVAYAKAKNGTAGKMETD